MHLPRQFNRRELWRRSYPTTVGVLLSIFQMILSQVIAGCESVSIFIQFPRMNAFVGYWTYPFFTCAWISLAGASCCCRIRCCGIATLIFQCFSMVMSLCVIGFDSYFLIHPLECFFSTYCSYSGYTYANYWDLDTLYGIKVPVIRGQLSAGVLMFVSCFIYMIMYSKTNTNVSREIMLQNNSPAPINPIRNHFYTTANIHPINTLSIPSNNELTCPECRRTFQVTLKLKV